MSRSRKGASSPLLFAIAVAYTGSADGAYYRAAGIVLFCSCGSNELYKTSAGSRAEAIWERSGKPSAPAPELSQLSMSLIAGWSRIKRRSLEFRPQALMAVTHLATACERRLQRPCSSVASFINSNSNRSTAHQMQRTFRESASPQRSRDLTDDSNRATMMLGEPTAARQ